jgi:hypothetical protein
MKKLPLLACCLLATAFSAGPAQARNDLLHFDISGAMNTPDAQQKVDHNIRMFWGDQKHPKPAQEFGQYTTNLKTNAFNKSDQAACEWVFLSAVIALQDRAKAEGGNAVVDIHSYIKKNDVSSETDFQCELGTFTAGVTLRGTVVKLP